MHSRLSGPAPSRETSADTNPLAAVISLLRPQAVLAKVITGAGEWSIRKAAYENPAFCLILEGTCFMDIDGVGIVELQEGDFMLLPATPAFTLASDLSLEPTLSPHEYGRETRHGSSAAPTGLRMLGGYFRFDPANTQLLLRLLPSAVLIRNGQAGAERLRRVAELIGDEATSDRVARDPILERLVGVVLLEALRSSRHFAAQSQPGLIAGLSDPALARPLRGIHTELGRRWTVAELARAAGMSRAVFSARFARTVGMPPMQYLNELRMAVARDLLRRERPPLAELAERIGYQSASAFSTAFTRSVGCSPSEFVRTSQRDA
jgi:AraC-like DNA-binding protein